MSEARCTSCGKKVAFLKDENGKTQILDVVAPVYQVGPPGLCRRFRDAHVSHFATCPNATKHSKKGAS